MTAFAAVTFAVFTVGFALGMWALSVSQPTHKLAMYFTGPYKRSHSRWAVIHRFGRKLWFAVLISAWDFSDPTSSSSLALLVFVSLIILLGVQVMTHPYEDERDNRLELCCVALLLYGYFVSVLPGASSSMETSVLLLQLALGAYALQRWVRARIAAARVAGSRIDLAKSQRPSLASATSATGVQLAERSQVQPDTTLQLQLASGASTKGDTHIDGQASPLALSSSMSAAPLVNSHLVAGQQPAASSDAHAWPHESRGQDPLQDSGVHGGTDVAYRVSV